MEPAQGPVAVLANPGGRARGTCRGKAEISDGRAATSSASAMEEKGHLEDGGNLGLVFSLVYLPTPKMMVRRKR